MPSDRDSTHIPVLLEEVVAAMRPRGTGVYVDCTFGRGGHARALLSQLAPSGVVVGLDKDPEAVLEGRLLANADRRFRMMHSSFAGLGQCLAEQGFSAGVQGVLFDLGVSSAQLDDPKRGFSFLADGPLDMRMNPQLGVSASDWLAHAEQTEIAGVLRGFGEERFAGRIARHIVEHRQQQGPLTTTSALVNLIERAVPRREKNKHPATRTFQALRIQVNGELDELASALSQSVDALAPGGRLVVLSFHSLEDRLVKRFIRSHAKAPPLPRHLPVVNPPFDPTLVAVGKAMFASKAEVHANPRSRSAVLRVAEKTR